MYYNCSHEERTDRLMTDWWQGPCIMNSHLGQVPRQAIFFCKPSENEGVWAMKRWRGSPFVTYDFSWFTTLHVRTHRWSSIPFWIPVRTSSCFNHGDRQLLILDLTIEYVALYLFSSWPFTLQEWLLVFVPKLLLHLLHCITATICFTLNVCYIMSQTSITIYFWPLLFRVPFCPIFWVSSLIWEKPIQWRPFQL